MVIYVSSFLLINSIHCIPYFIQLLLDIFFFFRLWTVTNKVALNMHIAWYVFVLMYVFFSLGSIPRSGKPESYGGHKFIILRHF